MGKRIALLNRKNHVNHEETHLGNFPLAIRL